MRNRYFLFLFCGIALVSSCSNRIGYSTVLWSIPEKNIYASDIITVYIKSNISKIYIAGVPKTSEKIEIPFWQITEPNSKSKAKADAKLLKEYQYTYARVSFDGLPVRLEPTNTARQVYRLKQNEIIKPLYEVEGVAVMSGGKPMEGKWLRVLTQDGTKGYCFSYNLRLFDEREGESEEVVVEEVDTTLENILNTVWYPENFLTMINNKQINLSLLNKNYYFHVDTETATIKLQNDQIAQSFEYKGITKVSYNKYELTDTPLSILVRNENLLSIQFISSNGLLQSHNFVKADISIDEIIDTEQNRRSSILRSIASGTEPYKSSNYGKLSIQANGDFVWTGYNKLVPSIIARKSGTEGNIAVDMFLSKSLATQYDGVLRFAFSENPEPVYFFYTLEDTGLRLEDANRATKSGKEFRERNTNALILFFGK